MAKKLTRDETEHGKAYYLASDVDAEMVVTNQKASLYEKLRKLNPRQFKELHDKNIAGLGSFDDLVHAMKE